MKNLVYLFLMIFGSISFAGDVIYVADVTDPLEDGTIEHPFDAIQKAVDAAHSDTVVVKDGIYFEDVDFKGKAVTIISENGPENCIVNSFKFIGCEDGMSVLDGFTVTKGIDCYYSPSPTITNNIITGYGHNGIMCNSSSPTIMNNTINGKSYGIICRPDTSPTITNNTITDNFRGITGEGHSLYMITNCILWGNTRDQYNCTVTYSCIQDGAPGIGNISTDPLFVDAVNGDYRLMPDSPCIDAGDPNIDNPRVTYGRIDMGAYEYEMTEWPGFFADVQGDDCVNVLDLLIVRGNLGASGSLISPPSADVNKDGVCNILDLMTVRVALGTGPGCP